jgi:hypothetical protein
MSINSIVESSAAVSQITVINSDEEHKQALVRLLELMDSELNSVGGDELDALADLIMQYENGFE